MTALRLLPCLLLVLCSTAAEARRRPCPLRTIVRGCAGAAIVKVEAVREVDGLRVAVARVERRIKGLAGQERVAFVAQRLRSTDRSHAVAGERILLLVGRLNTRRLLRAARMLSQVRLYRIACQGDGRLPLLVRAGRTYARVGHLQRIGPLTLHADENGLRTLARLDEVERQLGRWLGRLRR